MSENDAWQWLAIILIGLVAIYAANPSPKLFFAFMLQVSCVAVVVAATMWCLSTIFGTAK